MFLVLAELIVFLSTWISYKGFLFLSSLDLYDRKSGREKGGVPNIKSSQMLKANGGKSSSRKAARANGIYPAEKLKFGA